MTGTIALCWIADGRSKLIVLYHETLYARLEERETGLTRMRIYREEARASNPCHRSYRKQLLRDGISGLEARTYLSVIWSQLDSISSKGASRKVVSSLRNYQFE